MRFALVILIMCFSAVLQAAEDNFQFNDPAQRAAFLRLTEQLRCPMCQNQNIADSDAMIAHDMRRKVYKLLQEGKSEQQVIDYMKARYGDFVSYQPPVTSATIWLWVLPVFFAFLMIAIILRRRKPAIPDDVAEKLAKAEEMLKQDK